MPSVYLADFPEPDRIEGAPHPRETAHLCGHAQAQAEYLGSYMKGSEGVGKMIGPDLLPEPEYEVSWPKFA